MSLKHVYKAVGQDGDPDQYPDHQHQQHTVAWHPRRSLHSVGCGPEGEGLTLGLLDADLKGTARNIYIRPRIFSQISDLD